MDNDQIINEAFRQMVVTRAELDAQKSQNAQMAAGFEKVTKSLGLPGEQVTFDQVVSAIEKLKQNQKPVSPTPVQE